MVEAQLSLEGGNPAVRFNPKAIKRLEEPFKFATIARLLGGGGRLGTNYSYVFSSLGKQWGKVKNPCFSIVGNGRFLIRVDTEAKLAEVIQRRAWRVGGRTLIASRWQPGLELKINAVEMVMLWVQLPQLPIHLWNEYCYKGIARVIRGEYVVEDNCSGKWKKVGFARVKLEVPINFLPVPCVSLDLGDGQRITQEVVYESRISFCDLCGSLTHTMSTCKKLTAGEAAAANPWARVKMATKTRKGHPREVGLSFAKQTGSGDETVRNESREREEIFRIVAVYMPNNLILCRNSFAELAVFLNAHDIPTLIYGDFNAMRNSLNKTEPLPTTREGRQVISEAWGAEVQGCPMLRVLRKLEVMKCSQIYLTKNSFGRIEDNIKSLQCRLRQAQANSEAGDGWAMREEEFIKRELEKALHLEEIMWKEKSRAKWLLDEDKNTRFFQAIANNRTRKNRIAELEVAGQTFSSINSMLEVAGSYFECFLNEARANGKIPSDIGQGEFVYAEENASLLEPATYAEVKEAVMSLDKDSAPGPEEKLVRSLNKTYLMFIPKKRGARRIEDFRPIALCNSLYKVIIKVMVQRMKNILPRLIGISQWAFVKSRVIHDQIAMANELVHLFDNRKEAVACFKLNISKAYDRVPWRFLHNSLLYLGFHLSWVEKFMLCVSPASYTVLINGDVGRNFTATRGVRQGDPMSPYLFILVMEMAARYLKEQIMKKVIRLPYSVRAIYDVHCLMFADDLLLFSVASVKSITNIKRVLSQLEERMGFIINNSNSSLFTFNIGGWQVVKLPLDYLGVSLFTGNLNVNLSSGLISKFKKKMAPWKTQLLSYAGRACLITHNLSSMGNFWMQSFSLPNEVLKKLEQCMTGFLWADTEVNQHIHQIVWHSLCKPKAEGRIGLRAFSSLSMDTNVLKIVTYKNDITTTVMGMWRLIGMESNEAIFTEVQSSEDEAELQVLNGWLHSMTRVNGSFGIISNNEGWKRRLKAMLEGRRPINQKWQHMRAANQRLRVLSQLPTLEGTLARDLAASQKETSAAKQKTSNSGIRALVYRSQVSPFRLL
ncbi:Transposon TX1 uncharacterized protein [Nymphaea thermarum]|nr:Transposon TX1 uncharacterized protein [Nymphaea thermarum]